MYNVLSPNKTPDLLFFTIIIDLLAHALEKSQANHENYLKQWIVAETSSRANSPHDSYHNVRQNMKPCLAQQDNDNAIAPQEPV